MYLYEFYFSYAENYDKYLEQFVDVQMQIHAQKSPLLTKLKDKQLSEYKKEALKQEENALDDITNGKVANSLD